MRKIGVEASVNDETMIKISIRKTQGTIVDFLIYEEDRSKYVSYLGRNYEGWSENSFVREEMVRDFGLSKDGCWEEDLGHLVCYVGDDEEGIKLSQYYSLKMKKRFLSLMEDQLEDWILGLDKKNSVTFVIEAKRAERVQKILSLSDDKLLFGLYVFRDLHDLLFCFNKSYLWSELSDRREKINTITVNRVDFVTESIVDEENRLYIPRKCATKDNFLSGAKDKEALSFIGHGRDELIWITDGVICPGACDVMNEDQRRTSCQISNKCFKDNIDVIKIQELTFSHVFINACSSGKLTPGVYGSFYNVAHQFMQNNAVTYIGTPFLASCCPALNSFYEVLIQQGYTVGEICQRLNRVYNTYNYGSGIIFFLYGDPDVALTERKQVPVFEDCFHPGKQEIKLKGRQEVLRLKISDVSIQDFLQYRKGFSIKSKGVRQLSMIFFPDGDGIEGFVFGIDKAMRDSVTMEMLEFPEFNIGAINGYRYVVEMGLSIPVLKNYYYESVNSVQNYLSEELDTLFQANNVYAKNYSKRLKIFERYNKISADYTEFFQNKIAKKGFAFDAQCMEDGFRFAGKNQESDCCPYCKSRTYQYGIYNELFGVNRINVFCTKCGVIRDEADDEVELSFLDEEYSFVKDRCRTVNVELRNKKSRELFGHLAIAIANDNDLFSYDPLLQKIRTNREKERYQFQITNAETVSSHGFWLLAVANVNGKFYFIKKDIFYV